MFNFDGILPSQILMRDKAFFPLLRYAWSHKLCFRCQWVGNVFPLSRFDLAFIKMQKMQPTYCLLLGHSMCWWFSLCSDTSAWRREAWGRQPNDDHMKLSHSMLDNCSSSRSISDCRGKVAQVCQNSLHQTRKHSSDHLIGMTLTYMRKG